MVNELLKATAQEVGKKVLAEGLYILGTQLVKVSKELGRKDEVTSNITVNGSEVHWADKHMPSNIPDTGTLGAYTYNKV